MNSLVSSGSCFLSVGGFIGAVDIFFLFIPTKLISRPSAVSYLKSPPPSRPVFDPCTQSKIRRGPACRSRPSICGQGLWRRGLCRGFEESCKSPFLIIAWWFHIAPARFRTTFDEGHAVPDVFGRSSKAQY